MLCVRARVRVYACKITYVFGITINNIPFWLVVILAGCGFCCAAHEPMSLSSFFRDFMLKFNCRAVIFIGTIIDFIFNGNALIEIQILIWPFFKPTSSVFGDVVEFNVATEQHGTEQSRKIGMEFFCTLKLNGIFDLCHWKTVFLVYFKCFIDVIIHFPSIKRGWFPIAYVLYLRRHLELRNQRVIGFVSSQRPAVSWVMWCKMPIDTDVYLIAFIASKQDHKD